MADDTRNSGNDYLVENIECVTINGKVLTPAIVERRLEEQRKLHFDLQLIATPIVSEAARARDRKHLTQEQCEALDYSPYNLSDDIVSERRFKNEFDYYAALLRATEDNADQVSRLKRNTVKIHTLVRQRYNEVYDDEMISTGRKNMGSNDAERSAWFREKYPALSKIYELYDGFLDEVQIELERWQDFSKAASRMLSATELSYRASGRLFDRGSGKYIA